MDPVMIFIAGTPCTGKTTLARGIALEIPSVFVMEKDDINTSLSQVRPTTNGNLPPAEKYLETQYTEQDEDEFGPVIKLPKRQEFFGRHVRDQTYQVIIDIAKRNLELGKSPILESLLTRQFNQKGLVENIWGRFERYKKAMVLVYLPEDILKERMRARMDVNPEARLRDEAKFRDDSAWREYMRVFPIFPDNLYKFQHCKIDGTRPREECVKEALDYILS